MSDLAQQFDTFDAKNPHVYDLFKRFTLEAIAAGKKALGVSLIIERIRWEVDVTTQSDDGFKINNNHRAFYARKFMREHPQFDGFFHTRVQHGL